MGVRLLRSNPLNGEWGGAYYVVDGGRLLGRVRQNDGWNAAYAVGDRFETIGGTWRTRYAAVEGLIAEMEGEGVEYLCSSCGGRLDFVSSEPGGDSWFICARCGNEWAGSTLGYPLEEEA